MSGKIGMVAKNGSEKFSLTNRDEDNRMLEIFVKEAKLNVTNSYVSVMIMQRRKLVAVRGDGLLLLYS